MATYTYRCSDCKAEQEEIHPMTEEPKIDCKACGTESIKRIIQATGFRLSGGAWFKDGYNK